MYVGYIFHWSRFWGNSLDLDTLLTTCVTPNENWSRKQRTIYYSPWKETNFSREKEDFCARKYLVLSSRFLCTVFADESQERTKILLVMSTASFTVLISDICSKFIPLWFKINIDCPCFMFHVMLNLDTKNLSLFVPCLCWEIFYLLPDYSWWNDNDWVILVCLALATICDVKQERDLVREDQIILLLTDKRQPYSSRQTSESPIKNLNDSFHNLCFLF